MSNASSSTGARDSKSAKKFLATGSVAALLAVALGAFGAHALEGRLGPDLLATWQTAVLYQMFNALGLLVVGLVALRAPDSQPIRAAGWMLVVGIVLFSGSLYALSTTGAPWLGAVTPLGGIAFLAGWTLLARGVLREL